MAMRSTGLDRLLNAAPLPLQGLSHSLRSHSLRSSFLPSLFIADKRQQRPVARPS